VWVESLMLETPVSTSVIWVTLCLVILSENVYLMEHGVELNLLVSDVSCSYALSNSCRVKAIVVYLKCANIPLHFLLVSCRPLDAPENGQISCNGSMFEDVCTFTCDEGYELSGTPIRTCQSDQTWSGSTVTCSKGMILLHGH